MLPYQMLPLLIFITFINCQRKPEGYYWKDYAGLIPDDAYQAGLDHNGRPIFIGQTIHADYLVTVKLYHTGGKGYYPFGNREHAIERQIKVLCTMQPERFIWVQTTSDSVAYISDGRLVIGGSDRNNPTYIGRMFYKLETTVGKIIADDRKWGLYIVHDGDEMSFQTFEVLVYNYYTRQPL
ncbi:hypothetical protein ILUMI_17947 [Ignelater luminosus]|uniref:Uncharacterized protein n=1 Tax=Ignelater luminosus TaxID=2038154 RepID=A0A8K0CN42_IGNLU|nr:hypothetical protein ILUMI_17947 [Ignelater luminosus]